MKQLAILSLFLLTSCLASQNEQRAVQVDVMYGHRDFAGNEEWEQTDQHDGAYGIQATAAPMQGWGPEFGFIWSGDESSDDVYVNRSVDETDTSVREMYMGGRYNHMVTDHVQVYVGGGITAVTVETEVDLSYTDNSPRARDTAFAPYLQVGTNIYATEDFAVGAFYRRNFLDSEADIHTYDVNVDGDLLMLTVGWRF